MPRLGRGTPAFSGGAHIDQIFVATNNRLSSAYDRYMTQWTQPPQTPAPVSKAAQITAIILAALGSLFVLLGLLLPVGDFASDSESLTTLLANEEYFDSVIVVVFLYLLWIAATGMSIAAALVRVPKVRRVLATIAFVLAVLFVLGAAYSIFMLTLDDSSQGYGLSFTLYSLLSFDDLSTAPALLFLLGAFLTFAAAVTMVVRAYRVLPALKAGWAVLPPEQAPAPTWAPPAASGASAPGYGYDSAPSGHSYGPSAPSGPSYGPSAPSTHSAPEATQTPGHQPPMS